MEELQKKKKKDRKLASHHPHVPTGYREKEE